MDNNPVTTPTVEIRHLGDPADRDDRSLAPGSLPRGPRAIAGSRGRSGGERASALKLVQVRLRIPLVLVIAALVVGRWDVIRNYWDRLTRVHPLREHRAQRRLERHRVFLPDGPGRRLDWPGKCGICNMALVRRKRGEAVALPDGVVARMQLSPYRIQLAGIQTAPAAFRPLVRELRIGGARDARAGAPRRCCWRSRRGRRPGLPRARPRTLPCRGPAGPRPDGRARPSRGARDGRRLGIPPRHDRDRRSRRASFAPA